METVYTIDYSKLNPDTDRYYPEAVDFETLIAAYELGLKIARKSDSQIARIVARDVFSVDSLEARCRAVNALIATSNPRRGEFVQAWQLAIGRVR